VHYLIIGGGPAGLCAAATLRRIDETSRITILTGEQLPPYSRIALPYLLTGPVEEKLLFLPVPPKVNVVLGETAAEVIPRLQEVRTSSGRRFQYDSLLIATGSRAIRPEIEGSRLPFVFTIRDLPDIRSLRRVLAARRTGHAVIAGAGPVGLELSNALHKLGYSVTLVISSGRVFSTMLDEASSAFLQKSLEAAGVEIRITTDVVKISPSGEVLLSSGETRLCDVVVFGKGVTPSMSFLDGSGIETRQGITVDAHQQTSVPGIYAAGDVAETKDLVYGDSRVNALWPVAFEQGRVAAYNMAWRPLAYDGSYSRNILRVFGLSIAAAGNARSDTPQARSETGPDFHRRLALKDGILEGFVLMGEVRNEGLYNDLLRRRVPFVSCYAKVVRKHMKP
jgi:nitrite reductase (NADH) large subunit